jgi:hypothetical protein
MWCVAIWVDWEKGSRMYLSSLGIDDSRESWKQVIVLWVCVSDVKAASPDKESRFPALRSEICIVGWAKGK